MTRAAAVVGAALSSATGGDAQSGASIAANAVKNNEYGVDVELAAAQNRTAKEVIKEDEIEARIQFLDEVEQNTKTLYIGTVSGGKGLGNASVNVIYDPETDKRYYSFGGGIGKSVLPVNGEIGTLIVTTPYEIDLKDSMDDIIEGPSIEGEANFILGFGVGTPLTEQYAGKVFIKKVVLGTTVGADVSISGTASEKQIIQEVRKTEKQKIKDMETLIEQKSVIED